MFYAFMRAVMCKIWRKEVKGGREPVCQCCSGIALGWSVLLVTLGAAVQLQEILCCLPQSYFFNMHPPYVSYSIRNANFFALLFIYLDFTCLINWRFTYHIKSSNYPIFFSVNNLAVLTISPVKLAKNNVCAGKKILVSFSTDSGRY